MVSKDDFKNLFQTLMKEMFTKKAKTSAEGDEDSLDMNVFEKLMAGKQHMFVSENNDDLIRINDTNTCDNSIQNKCTHGSIKHNDYGNDCEEVSYPLSKRIKLKNEPEKAQENVPVLLNYSHSRNPPCATDAQTNPSAQRATKLRSVLARVYAVSIQNQITTTVP
jgi:hypothetical protein